VQIKTTKSMQGYASKHQAYRVNQAPITGGAVGLPDAEKWRGFEIKVAQFI
jgi:hypothetical protein